MCKNLLRLNENISQIENVLLTHFHGDHYFDIPFFYLLKSKSENRNINVYCDKKGQRKIQKLIKLAFPNTANKIKKDLNLNYKETLNFKITDKMITKYLVEHGQMKPAFAYVLQSENICIGFTGDTKLCNNVEYIASFCNYLFCDCMFIEGSDKHMGIDNIKYLAQKYPQCTFVVSHLNIETRNELNKINFDNVIVPEDGMEFVIN